MPKAHLTHRAIETFVAGRWMTDYWDEQLPGFGVRVSKSGRKTFIVRYKGTSGSKRRLNLGVYPVMSLAEARDQACEKLAAIAKGEDPQVEKVAEREAVTFGDLAAIYLERHAKIKKRRWKEDERILRVDLLPQWRSRKAKSLGRREVGEVLDAIVARGAPIMANRVKALISKIYNFGIGRGLVEHNPCLLVPMPARERPRERVLSEEEIRRLWCALDDEHPVMAATFRMRLLTAQRGVEVLKMCWRYIDGDWWTIPADVAKNGLTHRVPLAPQALALLDELRLLTVSGAWVFASPRKPGRHIVAVQKAAERIAERAGVNFVPHDLRRTAATFMTSMGISRLVVSKLLNHVESGVTQLYDRHTYGPEKAEALTRWADRLDEILTG